MTHQSTEPIGVALGLSSGAGQRRPIVVGLDHPGAVEPALAGAKAAALARARGAGLAVLPGFVVTTAFDGVGHDGLRDAWQALSNHGERSLVVRSSATVEDGDNSSMAGLFVSRLDVHGWRAFVEAVDDVRRSAAAVATDVGEMAVLVQPFLEPAWGGVLFGVDPVTERAGRMRISAVAGGPDALVSGRTDGWNAVLKGRGHVVEASSDDGPDRGQLRDLMALARRLEALNGRPQDIEWAIDGDGQLWLLQSRPITTLHGPTSGPVYGPGPVAETFPDPLTPLEQDLWLDPLRDGLRQALAIVGTAPGRRLRRAPLVIAIDGRVAADLGLLGLRPKRRAIVRLLDFRPAIRRLRAAWRVGRLGPALPALSRDLIEEIDRDLLAVPALGGLRSNDLLRILANGQEALRGLHGYEALAGMLLDPDPSVTAAGLALAAVRQARAENVAPADLVARDPVVLALLPPAIPPHDKLPEIPASLASSVGALDPTMQGVVREALRLRVRWVQELMARAASELGRRAAATKLLPEPADVRTLRFEQLQALVRQQAPVTVERSDTDRRAGLPGAFRLAADGTPVAVADGSKSGGTPVGGGLGRGRVRFDPADAEPGTVLVVATLDPRLAAVIPVLSGLVAETGSALSHLAILAREHGVPTVVARPGATDEFAHDAMVEVDGSTGAVRLVDQIGGAS
ncbi:MAG TPA: PEP/pyruvate-binding domain-containing protein [Acidimicrobiales bacterium]|jgi:pyruvate,water dikinase